jgi:hypothetical protein
LASIDDVSSSTSDQRGESDRGKRVKEEKRVRRREEERILTDGCGCSIPGQIYGSGARSTGANDTCT